MKKKKKLLLMHAFYISSIIFPSSEDEHRTNIHTKNLRFQPSVCGGLSNHRRVATHRLYEEIDVRTYLVRTRVIRTYHVRTHVVRTYLSLLWRSFIPSWSFPFVPSLSTFKFVHNEKVTSIME